MKKPTAVIDTNIFVSATIVTHGKPAQLINILGEDQVTLITSSVLSQELLDTLTHPVFVKKYHPNQEQIGRIFRFIKSGQQVKNLQLTSILIRDPKDIMVLATALTGKADYLVTGDKDLLEVKSHPKIGKLKIVTVDQFLRLPQISYTK